MYFRSRTSDLQCKSVANKPNALSVGGQAEQHSYPVP